MISLQVDEASAASTSDSAYFIKGQPISQFFQDSSLEAIQGSQLLSDRIQSSPEDHLVVFFATWCSFCKQEIQNFLKQVKSGECPRISFISLDDDVVALRSYLKSMPGWHTPIFWVKEKKMRRALDVKRLPFSVYSGRDKKIFRARGGSLEVEKQIEFLIAGADGRKAACE